MYDTILVGTDGSAPANRAVVHALEQAEETDATLHAIFVVDMSRYGEGELDGVDVETEELERWGQDKLEDVEDRAETLGVDLVAHQRVGDPHAEIISYADDIDADLIVLGYQGHAHQDTDHLGSVTDRVVRRSGRPVLVV